MVVTNVRHPVLAAYLRPLAELPRVAEILVVRDRPVGPLGEKVRELTFPRWWPGGLLPKLVARRILVRAAARRFAPDALMLLHWFPDGPMVTGLGQRLGVPVVANIIGGRAELIEGGRRVALSPAPGWVKRALEGYHRRWLNRVHVLTFTGRATERWFREAGVGRPAARVLHAAIDVPSRTVPARDVDVAYVGRHDADKRADRLFQVLHGVAAARPGTSAVVVGMGEAEVRRLPEYRTARGAMGDRLELHGYVPRVADVLGRARVLLVTSDTEGRPLAALEAMACGACVVATAVGDLAEVLADGRGIGVPLRPDERETESSLVAAVVGLLADGAARQEMAGRAGAYIQRAHTVGASQADWRAVLHLAGLDGGTP